MPSITFFTKYSTNGATSRYRVYNYLPYFKQAGFETIVKPFFTNKYLELFYGHKPISKLYVLKRYLNRIKDVLLLPKGSLLYIEYELLPYFPAWLEKWLHFRKIKYAAAYDDAIFHNYDHHPNGLIRKLLGNKIPAVMKMADAVITGSQYLTDFAGNHNANVVEIPTCINIEKYKQEVPARSSGNLFTIGWIGSPTNSRNVVNILPALKKFMSAYPSQLVLVGFDRNFAHHFDGLPVKILDWNEADEIRMIKSFDVGIMPLDEKKFNKGKCGFKLIQYMASGIPTISTPMQSNVNINKNQMNLFAGNTDEWYTGLKRIYENLSYYKEEVGRSNIEIAEKYYSIQATHPVFVDVFKKMNDRIAK